MALFNNPKKVVYGIVLFLILLILGFVIPQCHASSPFDAPYVQFSGGSTVVRGLAPVIDLTFTQPTSVLRNAYWQESLTLIGSSTFRGQSAPNNAVIRGLFVDGFGNFDIGLGISWMINPRPYNNPTGFNFNLQAAYRFKKIPLTLTYTHFSSAGTREPNLGRDLLMVGYRFH